MNKIVAGLLATVMGAALLNPGVASAQWRSPTVTAPPIPKDKTITPGDFWAEPPTLVSLGFEWRVNGDGNHNAKVAVSYRKKGETAWHEALPLVRSLLLSATQDESVRKDRFVRENLDVMAVKLGVMQAQLMRLEALGERVSGLAGIKTQEFNFLAPPAAVAPRSPAIAP